MRIINFFYRKIKFDLFKIILIVLLIYITLAYISLLKHTNEQRKEALKKIQQTLIFRDKPQTNRTADRWHFIGDPKLRHQQYSSFFDPRTEILDIGNYDDNNIPYGSIRIFAVLPLKLHSKIFCVLKFEPNETQTKLVLEAEPIHEHFDMPFTGYSIVCPLETTTSEKMIKLPKYVALSYSENPPTLINPTYLQINYPQGNILAKPHRDLAVCIGPLQKHYSDALRMAEFIEMYRILGAEKFYFYKLSVSNDIDQLLQYYEKENIIEILDWNFHGYKFEKEVRYGGQLVEVNECVYRATFVDGFEYVAIVDLDEILMPLEHNSLTEFLDDYDDKRTSAFVFQNTFLHKSYKNDYFTVPPKAKNRFLYTQVIIQRTKYNQAHTRSKYIANARAAIELGIHQVWRSADGFSETIIKHDVGLLFHYRNKCVTSSCDALLYTEHRARSYGLFLWPAVENACDKAFKDGICPRK